MEQPDGRRFTVNDLLAEARAGLDRLDPRRASQLVARSGTDPGAALLIDVRQHTDRWREGVIAGSVHIPLTVFEWAVDPASGVTNDAVTGFEQLLVVMCNEGYQSSLAAATLQRLGFTRATDLIGGFRGWKAAGLPTQPSRPHDENILDGRWPPEPFPSCC